MLRNLTKLLNSEVLGNGARGAPVFARSLAAVAEVAPDVKSNPKHNCDIELLNASFLNSAQNLMHSIYHKDEPLHRCMGVTSSEAMPFVNHLIGESLRSKVSNVAIDRDSSKLVGVQLSVIHDNQKPLDKVAPYKADPGTPWNVQQIMDFYDFLLEDLKFEYLPNAKKFLQLVVATVDRDHRRLGLGKALAEASLEEAKQQGCDFAASISTTWKSHKFLNKLGFVSVKTVNYDSFIDPANGQRLFGSIPKDETNAKVMIKQL